MQMLAEPTGTPLFDLEILEFDSTPTFVIRVGTTAIDFELLYANKAFRTGGFRDAIQAQDLAALRFRSWAQAMGPQGKDFHYDFAGTSWFTEIAMKSGALKMIKAMQLISKERNVQEQLELGATQEVPNILEARRSPINMRSKEEYMEDVSRDRPALLRNLPRTNLNARWEGLQTMMEMSDVGVFEYTTDGKLIHANEAWYKLRLVQLAHVTMYRSSLTARIPRIFLLTRNSHS
jgi:PAS domain-containing protein